MVVLPGDPEPPPTGVASQATTVIRAGAKAGPLVVVSLVALAAVLGLGYMLVSGSAAQAASPAPSLSLETLGTKIDAQGKQLDAITGELKRQAERTDRILERLPAR